MIEKGLEVAGRQNLQIHPGPVVVDGGNDDITLQDGPVRLLCLDAEGKGADFDAGIVPHDLPLHDLHLEPAHVPPPGPDEPVQIALFDAVVIDDRDPPEAEPPRQGQDHRADASRPGL
jgi:hypothetical protein